MRVLLVDDLEPRARSMGDALADRGHSVRCLTLPDDARRAASDGTWDVLLVAPLAGHDHTAVCASLRSAAAEAFVLAMIDDARFEEVESLLDAGVDDCYRLPWDARRFRARLRVVERTIEQRARLVEAQRSVREGEATRTSLQTRLMLADRLVSVGTLAAGVAHEINNPLMYVIANLEFVSRALGTADGASTDEKRARLLRAMAQAREGADRVTQIVRGLRTFSRGDEDRRGPVSVVDVIESSLAMAWNEIRHRARLVRAFGAVALVEANEARLGQVFLNLLVNAAQAIPEGHVDRHEIRVSAWNDGSHVVVEVRDTGDGIAPEIQGRIFDPFFTTKPVGEGTGLGLSICHGIVTGLGGEITVESAQGVGSTFRVSLPASVAPRAPQRYSVPPAPPGARAKVLIVDDEPSLRSSLAQILATEHEVSAEATGQGVLARMRGGERFDVILCDLLMPEMSGVDLFQAIEAEFPEQRARVVFLTGGAFTPRTQEFLSRVPNPRLEKPFDIDDLLVLIRKVMR